MADTKEVSVGLFQHIGHDLEMDMRRPTAVFVPVAQMGNQLTRRHASAHLAQARKRSGQMAIERVEGRTFRIVFQNERMRILCCMLFQYLNAVGRSVIFF